MQLQCPNLTADDWGISPGVNDGILELCRKNIIKRVSVLAEGPFVSHRLDELRTLPVKTGLHFDLTLHTRRSKNNVFTLNSLTRFLFNPLVSASRKIDTIYNEVLRQISLLESLDLKVSYLDGHHHIHLVPWVNKGVALAMKEKSINQVRIPQESIPKNKKEMALYFLSTLSKPVFTKSAIFALPCIYPRPEDYASKESLLQLLEKNQDKEIITHPAQVMDFDLVGCKESYQLERIQEYITLLATFSS